MAGWVSHTGTAVCLPLDSVDTDQLIPARFMSVPRNEGYGSYLLHDLRRDDSGALLPDFPLNSHDGVSILVTGRNFGSGSSREAAVYALVDAGIRAVIGPSFGDIFAGNAVNNGLLAARVTVEDAAALETALGQGVATATVDLEAGVVSLGDVRVAFSLDDGMQTKLINGWDDIDLTQSHAAAIANYRQARERTAPWVWPKARSDNGAA
jgi:3-isopropylmalate/(R)-2-methylmalate dehydratase small subunit